MSDIRFQSFEDDDLAEHPVRPGRICRPPPQHFQKLRDQCFQELADCRGEGLDPWLEKRLKGVPGSKTQVDAAISKGALHEEQIK